MPDRDSTEVQALRALAERGDPKAVPPLLERVAERDAEAAELLVRFDLDEEALSRLEGLDVHGAEPVLRFWIALAFARAGRAGPLLSVLEEMRAGRIRRPLAEEPWSGVYDRLAAVRPLPPNVLAELRAIQRTEGVRFEVLAVCWALTGDVEAWGGRYAFGGGPVGRAREEATGARSGADRLDEVEIAPSRGLGMTRETGRRRPRREPADAADLAEADLARAEPEEAAAGPAPARGPATPRSRDGLGMAPPEPTAAAGPATPRKRAGRGMADPELDSGPTSGSPPPPRRQSAPRRAWPHLDAPDAVVAGVPFDLEVGLRGDPAPGVMVSGPLDLPAGPASVRVAVMAHGFDVDGPVEFDLEVTADDPYPRRTLVLTARWDDELAAERRIYAIYSVGSASRAVAERSVRVVPAAEDAAGTGGRPAAQPERADPGVVLTVPDAAVEADLTICIGHGNDAARHTLQWSLTPAAVELPPAPEEEAERVTSIGARPEEFLDQIVRKGSATANPYNLYRWLTGRGRAIGRAMPPFVRAAVARVVAERAPEPATILIKSAEPHVPWELAVLAELPEEPGAAPFLGARSRVGRWTLGPPPPLPDPPRRTEAGRALAVSGIYDGVPGWVRLPHAEAEPREVIHRVGSGDSLPPSFSEVVECLDGEPPGDVLHFALHGRFERGAARSGLVLLAAHPQVAGEVVEEFLEPDHVLGGHLEARRPFVFLNACQVGAAEALLGDYGGMAAAFLTIGASAVVAPLWSVNDEAAHEFALDFYDQTLGGERLAPAELLRRRRAALTAAAAKNAPDGDGLLSVLAYQLYAHPRYTLTRAAGAPPPQETDDG